MSTNDTPITQPSILLPVELIIPLLALAQPRSVLAAAASQLGSICSKCGLIQFTWRNSILLAPGDACPMSADAEAGHPSPKLVDMLMLLRTNANCSTGFAPSYLVTAAHDQVFTPQYLKYLYSHGLCVSAETLLAVAKKSNVPGNNTNWWRPIDALLVPVYLLQTGQLDLLDICLGFLSSSIWNGSRTNTNLQFSAWADLILDDRGPARQIFLGPSFATQPALYPLVLATLALLEWSLPSLQLILDRFPLLTPSHVTHHACEHAGGVIIDAMMALLGHAIPDHSKRIIDLYMWLASHNAPNLRFPLIGMVKVHAPLAHIKQVLVQADIPRLRLEATHQDEHEWMQSSLMQAVVYCTRRFGELDLVLIALECGLMRLGDWAAVLAIDVDKQWPVIQEHVPVIEERRIVVERGLLRLLANTELPNDESMQANLVKLARILQFNDFGVYLPQLMAETKAVVFPRQVIAFFAALNQVSAGPDPLPALKWTLSHLQSAPLEPFENRFQTLCSMATVFIYSSSLLPADFSASHVAILVAVVALTIAHANQAMHSLVSPIGQQMAHLESLISHCVTSSPPAAHASVFAHTTPRVRGALMGMIRNLPRLHKWSNLLSPAFTEWMLAQLARADPWFVGMAADESMDPKVREGVWELVPEHVRACVKMSRRIFEQAVHGEEIRVDWESVIRGKSWSQVAVEHMVGWMAEATRFSGRECNREWLWLRARVVGVVRRL